MVFTYTDNICTDLYILLKPQSLLGYLGYDKRLTSKNFFAIFVSIILIVPKFVPIVRIHFCIEPLFGSTVLRGNREWIEQLQEWLPTQLREKNMKLCYRASVNGWAASTFHSLCDKKGPTVVLVESGLYVFGGFASVEWGGKHQLSKWFYSRRYFSAKLLLAFASQLGYAKITKTKG